MRIRRPTERWFPCDNDPDEGSVLIKHLTPGELQDISNEAMPQEYEYDQDEDGKMIPKLKVGFKSGISRELTMIACIKDWKNFFDEEGNPLECTPENITRASREIEGLNDFIVECQNALAESIKEEGTVQEKNLSSSA
jgi:hypothetical protein